MSINKVILLGRVGKEPEIKDLTSGSKIANVLLATSKRGYTTKDGKEVPEQTEWHNIVLYTNLAKIVEQYVHKGDRLYIEGEIRTRSYENARGEKKYVTEIIANEMQMLGGKPQQKPEDNVPF